MIAAHAVQLFVVKKENGPGDTRACGLSAHAKSTFKIYSRLSLRVELERSKSRFLSSAPRTRPYNPPTGQRIDAVRAKSRKEKRLRRLGGTRARSPNTHAILLSEVWTKIFGHAKF